MSAGASAGFDRLRHRGTAKGGLRSASGLAGPEPAGGRPSGPAPVGGPGSPGRPTTSIGRDAHGKRALYSGVRPPGPRGTSLAVTCSRCGRTSTIGLRRALWVLTPSVHLPLPLRHPSLLRCPACGRPSWVRLTLRSHP
ncbi:hypothetical protein MXD62_02635 [Frankia sp. Mgl5]|uniref:hypothetical protein n=1 Tax=Frankia sp. Mgl5 TaxID=2933793 RepID=UPI00200C8D24|nr:hypothetical protein [Frankia sp. Mgl5]MCK9926071.1 hypothetical protein [Frankia sp. Mgl5]